MTADLKNTLSRNRGESGKTLTRLPHLASPVMRFNLSKKLGDLREQDWWHRETDRSSKTLAKYPDFRIVLVLMKADSEMKEHHADGRISIYCLQGKVCIHLPSEGVELAAGELMALDYGCDPMSKRVRRVHL